MSPTSAALVDELATCACIELLHYRTQEEAEEEQRVEKGEEQCTSPLAELGASVVEAKWLKKNLEMWRKLGERASQESRSYKCLCLFCSIFSQTPLPSFYYSHAAIASTSEVHRPQL